MRNRDPFVAFLVAFLEYRCNLAVYFIDLFIEGPELLLRVFEIGVQLFPVVLHRLQARRDPIQLAAVADLLRLLVHFCRRFTDMLDRVFYDAEAEEGAYGALHTLALGGQGYIRFDEAERPVAVREEDLA